MRIALVLLLLVAIIAAAPLVLRQPRADRQWEPALARPPFFVKTGASQWLLKDLRAFEFYEGGETTTGWRDEEIDADKLKEIWFFIEPFKAWDGVAHSLVSFVFDGEAPKTLSISVEARREKGDPYSPFRGAFNAYELIYVWSTEKDILTRIAAGLDHDIYAYRLNVTQEQARAILDHFIDRTNALHDHPRFYNTLTSNCTNELAKAVNDAFPGVLPWHYSYWLTGYAAAHLHALGFLGARKTPFAEIKAQAGARAAIKAAQRTPEQDFPDAWRSVLRRETADINNINASPRDE